MKSAFQTMVTLLTCLLLAACVSGGSDDETNNSNSASPDAFSLADIATADMGSAIDTWTPAPDLVSAEDISPALPENNDGCKVTLRAEARDASGPCTTCSFGDNSWSTKSSLRSFSRSARSTKPWMGWPPRQSTTAVVVSAPVNQRP